jgi:hypothetical protein
VEHAWWEAAGMEKKSQYALYQAMYQTGAGPGPGIRYNGNCAAGVCPMVNFNIKKFSMSRSNPIQAWDWVSFFEGQETG